MKVQTKSGFVWNVDPDRARDWRFCKYLALCDSDNGTEVLKGVTFCVPQLLGDDGEAALVKHVTNSKGIAPSDLIIKEFKEIIVLLGEESKKSQSSQG